LSIRNKFDEVKVKQDKMEQVKQWKLNNEKPQKTDDDNNNVVRHIPSDCETIVKLVKMLNPTRADDYYQWINVGACLFNINTELLGLWEEFSKQSKKYTDNGDGSCESKWRSFGSSRNKTTEGTLRYWAKHDNPQAYMELQKNDVSNLIYLSKNETHTDITKVVHHMYKDEYVCCYINDKPYWYEFKGHRWVECPNAVSLKQHLSHGVSKAYSVVSSQFALKSSVANEDNKEAEAKIYSEISHKLAGISMKLKNAPFKANIIKECQEVFAVSKKDFYDLLDENKYLLGFENGVYDLENKSFRDGMPSDYLTFSTGYDFTNNINRKVEAIINKFMFSMFEDDEMVEYMWNTTAYAICGDKYLEMFEFYTGTGANSKGTFGKLVKNAFGDYYYEPSVTVFTCKKTNASSANPELAKTKGKRFVMASEPEETDKFQVGAIKSWTGGDLIQARELFKNNIEFQCQFKIAIQMNNKPKLSNVDGGIARRIRMVHFPFKFVDEPVLANERKGDNKLKTQFETDKEIAQTFMMMLIQRYNDNIHGNQSFPIPNKVKEATQEYIDDNNKIKKFLAEYVEVTNNDDDMVLSKTLFEDVYKMSEYYENERKDWFVEKMGFNGFSSVRQNKRTLHFRDKMVYRGLKLKKQECMIESDDEL
jgi:P4 family phage/plasmid primase-like protien